MLREYLDAAAQARSSAETGPSETPRPPTPLSPVLESWASVPLTPSGSTLRATIARIEAIVDQETQELKRNKPVDLQDFNRRKSQGLLELTRLTRGLGAGAADRETRASLTRLRGKLDANLAALRLHLAAAQEVAALISRVIRDAESDGTYSSVFAGRV